MELAIDTSTETASVVLSLRGKVIAESSWQAGRNHTVELMPRLIQLLSQAGASLKDVGGIIVAKGPGSFSGLRVGMSVAKGLVLALGVPVVGISTLEVEAFPNAGTSLPVCPILDAGRGEIAAALFCLDDGKWRRLVEEHITVIDSLIAGIADSTVFCGRIPGEVAARLMEKLGEKVLMPPEVRGLERASSLAGLGWGRLEAGDFDHSPTLQPLYLRRPSITFSSKKR